MEKKADFKTMKKSEIAGFVWDYYKWFIIVGIIIIAAVVGIVRHFLSYKDSVVQIALLNCNKTQMEKEEPDFTDFMEMYGYDSRKEEIKVNTGYDVDINATSSAEIYSFQSFVALTAAGGVDVMAADEETYEFVAECRAIASLEEYLPGGFMEKYNEDIVYAKNMDTGEDFPAGIRIENNPWMVEHGFYGEDCVIGFGNGTKKEEAAVQMFLYILGESDNF
jgi:hypothetical protein